MPGKRRPIAQRNPHGQQWALVTAAGDVLDVVPTASDALVVAQANKLEAIVDRELDLGADIEQNPLGVRGPEVAHRGMGGLRVNARRAMAMSVEDAYRRLAPAFPQAKRGGAIKAWSSAKQMRENLLSANYKLAKTETTPAQRRLLHMRYGKSGINVQGLTLLPNIVWNLVVYGQEWKRLPVEQRVNTCVGASRECREACLVYSGRNEADPYNTVIKTAKLTALLREPDAFARMLVAACDSHLGSERTADLRMVRLNVFSDIPWELVFPELFEIVPGQFYDYTKVPSRQPPANYDLTFSYSGRNLEDAGEELRLGRRIAVVFLTKKHQLPAMFFDVPVVDGDISDARPLDPPRVVVGLSYKPPKKAGVTVNKKDNVFVVPVHELDGQLVAALVPRDQPDTEDPQNDGVLPRSA